MSGKDSLDRFDLQLPLRALLAWGLSALVWLLLFSLVISRFAVSSRSIAYCSSALSFLSAAAAGAVAAGGRPKNRLLTGALTGILLTLLLLVIGLTLRHSLPPSDGLISFVAFTLAGALFGSVFLSPRGKKGRGKRVIPASRKRTQKR